MNCDAADLVHTHRKEFLQDPDDARCQDFIPMLAVGRTTNLLFKDLVTKGTLSAAVDSISSYSKKELQEETSVTDFKAFASVSSIFYLCANIQGPAAYGS